MKRDGHQKPNEVCPENCKRPVFVTSFNINHLVRLLRENGIDGAAVAGRDCTPGNFVVDKYGKVRCYGKNDSHIRYVFCYADYRCPPKPCPPYPCRPFPCYPRRPFPCPPYPKQSPCYNPCAPKCPTINFNKACVDPCGRVSSAVQGSFSAFVPPRYPPYFPRAY